MTFDAGRYTEQNIIAMAKYGLPPMWSPKKFMTAREWKAPYGGSVRGEVTWGRMRSGGSSSSATRLCFNADEVGDRLSGLSLFLGALQLRRRSLPRPKVLKDFAVEPFGDVGHLPRAPRSGPKAVRSTRTARKSRLSLVSFCR